MSVPYLLHMFNPTKNVSPFDVNMAYEADVNGVIPYAHVGLEDIHSLTLDTIFSRGPHGVKRTGIFIGGRDFGLAIDMLNRAKAAMVPPFAVSVLADPSGAITTAAALMACVEYWFKKKAGNALRGANIQIIGGTGPVGSCAGVIAAKEGAEVHLITNQGTRLAQEIANEHNQRYGLSMKGGENTSAAAVQALMEQADIVLGTGPAGIRLLSESQLAWGKRLAVAADINAVPPLGIEGIAVKDMGKGLPGGACGLGALAVGDIKYKVHHRLLKIMIDGDEVVYLDHFEAFKVARQVVEAEFTQGHL